ncbi:EAL domain-containing protein [Parashewanella tropica]|uniref:EAL domain-containing protein n=1 Tax=Parashewanella tropica TaxID=2547970 RepID=UPI001478BBEB|nr:EAL domain-containing protein [Parashewanella tropica]
MSRVFFFFALLYVVAFPIQAEHTTSRILVKQDGLDSAVKQVLFDKKGYAWLVKEKGLYRTLNSHITKVGAGSLKHQSRNSFFVKGKVLDRNYLLVSSLVNAYRFNINENQFKPLSDFPAFKSVAQDGFTEVVTYDDSSFVMLTSHGLIYRVKDWQIPAEKLAQLDDANFRFKGMLKLGVDQLLVYNKHQLVKVNPTTQQISRYAWPREYGTINQIIQDSQDHLWLATSKGTFQAQNLFTTPIIEQHTGHATFSLSEDRQGQLWLATDTGVKIYIPKHSQFHFVEYDNSLGTIKKLFAEPTGLMWGVGRYNGIAVFNETPEFIRDFISSRYPYRLISQDIKEIYADVHYVWAAANNQLLQIDRETKTASVLEIPELDSDDTVTSLLRINQNYLLLTSSNGLFILNLTDNSILRFAQWANSAESLENRHIHKAVKDDSLNRIWFVVENNIFYWDRATSIIKKLTITHDASVDLSSTRDLMIASDGKTWLSGTSFFGFIENGHLQNLHPKKIGVSELPTYNQLYEMSPNTLWLGTYAQGMFEYNTQTQKLQPLNSRWNTNCQKITFMEQVQQHILVGCDDRIITIATKAPYNIRAVEPADGLPNADFNEQATFYDPKAGLYVGTSRGLLLLDPNKIQNRLENDGVFLSHIRAYYPDREELILHPSRSHAFAPDVSLLSLQLASHDYLEGQLRNVQYRFYNEGVSTPGAFVNLTGQSQINLSSLAAGNYVLELQGQVNGLNYQLPHKYHFKVLQNWWQANEFKTGLAFTALILGLILLLRHQSRANQTKRLNHELLTTQERLGQALKNSESDLWEWRTDSSQLVLGNYNKLSNHDQIIEVKSLNDLGIHPDDQDRVNIRWNRVLSGEKETFEAEYRQKNQGGEWRWIRSKGRATDRNLEDNSILTISGIYTDITATRNLEDTFSIMVEAFENTSEGVLIFNANQEIILSNNAAHSIVGFEARHLNGRTFSEMIKHSQTMSSMHELLAEQRSWHGELAILTSSQRYCPIWMNLSQMHSSLGNDAKFVAVISDITERKRTEAELIQLANYDGLTGLPNRTLFNRELTKAIHEAKQENQQLALMFLDLDRFKDINDTYGHSMGDAVLMEASKRLIDSIDENTILCRFGGDEFVVLMKQVKDIQQVDILAGIILKQIETPFIINRREFYISTSIGISLFPEHASTPEALIKNADLSMYHAKDEGRGNHQYYSLERYQANQYQLQLERDLRYAFKKHEFELNFQPQISVLDDDQMVGMEALLRWNHTVKGYIRPDVFIPIAESCGLIVDIDRWVLFASLRQLAKWQKKYQRKFRLSINVSAAHFRQPDYVRTVKSAIEQTGVQPESVGLEITEGVLMNELDIAQSHLSELHAMGVEVAIDDFGTGYSSLAYLRNFKVNTLKIDRKFIIDIAQNRADQAIVNSIVELARNLKLKVVAEGIETYEQLEHLIGRGCYLMQGYYFSKPLDIKHIEQYLEHADALERET